MRRRQLPPQPSESEFRDILQARFETFLSNRDLNAFYFLVGNRTKLHPETIAYILHVATSLMPPRFYFSQTPPHYISNMFTNMLALFLQFCSKFYYLMPNINQARPLLRSIFNCLWESIRHIVEKYNIGSSPELTFCNEYMAHFQNWEVNSRALPCIFIPLAQGESMKIVDYLPRPPGSTTPNLGHKLLINSIDQRDSILCYLYSLFYVLQREAPIILQPSSAAPYQEIPTVRVGPPHIPPAPEVRDPAIAAMRQPQGGPPPTQPENSNLHAPVSFLGLKVGGNVHIQRPSEEQPRPEGPQGGSWTVTEGP